MPPTSTSATARATSNAVTQMRQSAAACVGVAVVTSCSNVFAFSIRAPHVARACKSRGRVRRTRFRDTSNRVRSIPGLVLAVTALAVVTTCACGRPRKAPPAPQPTPAPLPTLVTVPPSREVEAVVARLGPVVRERLTPYFRYARVAYPPARVALLAFKRERRLEIWACDDCDELPPSPWRRVDARAILAVSGGAGPKLQQGDRQVPEGLYRLVAFNPNSRFHLSLMVDYPNGFDLAAAAIDGRVNLGGDIFIHGDARSIGCLAMGDRGIEDLFVLAADVGLERTEVVIAPWDPRGGYPLVPDPGIHFTPELYRRITARLAEFPAASATAPAVAAGPP
jgi:hypothetical protein